MAEAIQTKSASDLVAGDKIYVGNEGKVVSVKSNERGLLTGHRLISWGGSGCWGHIENDAQVHVAK